jgi:hypothetical protein
MERTVEDARNDRARIDRLDWIMVPVTGVLVYVMKQVAHAYPDMQLHGRGADLATMVLIGYFIYRARRAPARLDLYGLTTPLTRTGWFIFAAVLGGGIVLLMGLSTILGYAPEPDPKLIGRAVGYLTAAFPQQFLLCSIALNTLASLSVFQSWWRLPLICGVIFAAAHWWTPALIPGTTIPIQMVIGVPLGFSAAAWFLAYRNILPLVVCHAVFYPLWFNWIERHF